jgi:hypothetical protein
MPPKPDPDRAARPGWSSDTAVTRGQRLVVVVGQPKAPALAVRGARARRRWSRLGEWLSKSSVGSGPSGTPSGTIAARAAAPTIDGA